jgi:hypothetical protein
MKSKARLKNLKLKRGNAALFKLFKAKQSKLLDVNCLFV